MKYCPSLKHAQKCLVQTCMFMIPVGLLWGTFNWFKCCYGHLNNCSWWEYKWIIWPLTSQWGSIITNFISCTGCDLNPNPNSHYSLLPSFHSAIHFHSSILILLPSTFKYTPKTLQEQGINFRWWSNRKHHTELLRKTIVHFMYLQISLWIV